MSRAKLLLMETRYKLSKVAMLTAQDPGMPMLVEDIVVTVGRYMILQKSETVGVDRPDEHWPETVAERLAFDVRHPPDDAVLQLRRGSLRKRKCHDRRGFRAFGLSAIRMSSGAITVRDQ